MAFNLPPVGGVDPTGASRASRPARPAEGKKDISEVPSEAADVRVDAIPATPPPEVRAEVERASARYDELAAQKRELHFGSDPKTGRVRIEVRDDAGRLLRTIPPSEALEVISGKPVD